MSQKLDYVRKEPTACCFQAKKNVVHMVDVIFNLVRIKDGVIKKSKARLPFTCCENDVQGTLKGSRCVCKVKSHTNVLISSVMRSKHFLRSIFFSIIHLPVAQVHIKFRKHFRFTE